MQKIHQVAQPPTQGTQSYSGRFLQDRPIARKTGGVPSEGSTWRID
jgi:hypothetical protein